MSAFALPKVVYIPACSALSADDYDPNRAAQFDPRDSGYYKVCKRQPNLRMHISVGVACRPAGLQASDVYADGLVLCLVGACTVDRWRVSTGLNLRGLCICAVNLGGYPFDERAFLKIANVRMP